MEIIVKITQNYGTEAIYPVCEAAQTFARLAGTKTLTRGTIALIKRLGYTVNVQQDQVTL
jgi:hypothetical protein